MRQAGRILVIVLAAILVAATVAAPALAMSRSVIGAWETTDAYDGSHMTLEIGGGPSGSYFVRFHDTGLSDCGVDPESGAPLYAGFAMGFMSGSDLVLDGSLPVYCQTAPPSFLADVHFHFVYDPGSDTLVGGRTWTRR